MKLLLLCAAAILILLPFPLRAEGEGDGAAAPRGTASAVTPAPAAVKGTVQMDSVVVSARRRLREVGVQKTTLDTLALRDNITSSMADVLSRSSTIFIKSYGRATLSTASFRGTAPSHTVVTWNGMTLNSPMLGMVDFSTIPSYLVDGAALYHGASSVALTGGGMGGAVALSTRAAPDGLMLRYIQGISSFRTFDEFLQVGYGTGRWRVSTRAALSTSRNDFPFTNYHKKVFTFDDAGRITGFAYPVERNRNGSFRDLHILQEAGYDSPRWGHWNLSAWYFDSRRGLPMLNTDYRSEAQISNTLDEHTLRATLGWDKSLRAVRLSAGAGYTYTDMGYVFKGYNGGAALSETIHSQSYVNSLSSRAMAEWFAGRQWLVTGSVNATQNMVRSVDSAVLSADGQRRRDGYDQARLELSPLASVRWTPSERWGFSAQGREELSGREWSPPIVAGFAQYLLSRRGEVTLKASAARNYRFPTLNDLYFRPGGNPALKPERGFSYDGGIAARLAGGSAAPREARSGTDRTADPQTGALAASGESGQAVAHGSGSDTSPGTSAAGRGFELTAEATGYDSYIDNWILWRPVAGGVWSPLNIRRVRSYGAEFKARLAWRPRRDWQLDLDGNFTVSHAVNRAEPLNDNDMAVGQQLIYIPVYSGAATGRLSWRTWALGYRFGYYSTRYTTSDNSDQAYSASLPPYFMSDLSLEKRLAPRWARIALKLTVNNLLDEGYESVLHRPMAGRNYGFFIEIVPRTKN